MLWTVVRAFGQYCQAQVSLAAASVPDQKVYCRQRTEEHFALFEAMAGDSSQSGQRLV